MTSLALLALLLCMPFSVHAVAPRMLFVEAGRNGKTGPVLTNGLTFCPHLFSSNGYSIKCEISSSYAEFQVGSKRVRYERFPPFFISGDSNEYVFPYSHVWGTHIIGCYGENDQKIEVEVKFGCPVEAPQPETVSQQTPTSATPQRATSRSDSPDSTYSVRKDYCISRKGTDHINRLPYGWEKDGTAVTYLPNDFDKHKTVGASTAVLVYKFMVPVESTYGIVVDMETRDYTEFNDVFVSCDGGVMLRKGSKARESNRPVKAYHNKKGRAKVSSSVDFNPHAISTKSTFKPGREYRCRIHARSTRTTVHGLILFPCFKNECTEDSPKWQSYLRICNV